jgi:hypothetical protein
MLSKSAGKMRVFGESGHKYHFYNLIFSGLKQSGSRIQPYGYYEIAYGLAGQRLFLNNRVYISSNITPNPLRMGNNLLVALPKFALLDKEGWEVKKLIRF